MRSSQQVFAPWDFDQVASLNSYQSSGVFHPYTGRNGGDILVATRDGWKSAEGDFTQNWAWSWTTDWKWKELLREMEGILR